ncbi:iron chelate uptake ABC transporter family permease subunit [bacterium]|nr:iron chelate uptake ABC transporter family permease subunit [bacterium]
MSAATNAGWSTENRSSFASDAGIRWRRWMVTMPLLLLTCLALLWLSTAVGVGSVTLTPDQMWRTFSAPETATRLEIVATNARLSRALMALGVGVALGMAGALLQALYRNPLADPGITGVTQGAVTAAVAWIVFGPPLAPGQVSWVLPAVSALGAIFSATATWTITRLGGKVEPTRLILIGVLVGGVLGAITSIALLWADENTQTLISWLSGSLAAVTWQKVGMLGGSLLLVLPLTVLAIPMGNVLQFGDDVSAGLGQEVTPARAIVLITACLLTAAAVCTVGGIGFVGLVAPHLLRWWVGSDLRRLAPAAACAGGALVMAADLVARNLRPTDVSNWLNIPLNTAAVTLPVGVYLALLGGPFFLFLLRRTRGK